MAYQRWCAACSVSNTASSWKQGHQWGQAQVPPPPRHLPTLHLPLSLQTLHTPVQVSPQHPFGLPVLDHSVEMPTGEKGKLGEPKEEPE